MPFLVWQQTASSFKPLKQNDGSVTAEVQANDVIIPKMANK